jgi:hypothetical protein
MKQMKQKKSQKSSEIFSCEKCDYTTCRKFDYTKHLLTPKHQYETNETKTLKKSFLNSIDKCSEVFTCNICDTPFTSRTTLWRHKSKCIISYENNIINCSKTVASYKSDNDVIMMVIKQNTELKEFLAEQNKQNIELQNKVIELCKVSNNITNNVNSNNKTFNLQVFLNETCKDAMNISDFVESVKLQVSDLENVGKVGYIEGISNIIIKKLKDLDVSKRPVHCADQKREVMYIKDENIWEKEDENNKKLRKAIRMIAHKNICMFKDFREKYPDCEEYDSKKNSQYNKIVYESMGGKGDNDYEKDTKIIKKIAKAVGIEKM